MSATRHNEPHVPEPRRGPAPVSHELYDEHAAKLLRVVSSRVATSDANIDDACSFAWTQLIARGPEHDSIFAWLVTVATREAWRQHRVERRQAGDGDELVPVEAVASPTADAHAEDRLLLEEAVQALKTIHPRKRRMLVLHATGFTYDEIAREYGVSVERARELVYRARLQLRDRLGRGEGANPRRR